MLQIEYKSRLEGIEDVATDVLKEKLLEGPGPAASQRIGQKKTQ